ncbi:SrfA family protein [Erwinia tasmaniensis]|uniref:Virulence effector protein n=1 Tax=Erwinia tasmaniensis (strain DSM 17950 / CFBP 7177 / CIP 109463 / NCPPB 4357 / Et1/99) TaxID=465817 RepID=B2VKJ1_ERWT9|nr:SrfA family protein [Erwinia tasmaniensis]CAO96752.1 Putative virulence effector protein [Erwinia tasmaniensis Et1/99]
MAKIFLRSGNLNALLALGENGQPVYLSALQLRETLRLRKQSQIADCLAIPQLNDAGDRIDWYSPLAGKVTTWAAASNSARSAALNQLLICQSAFSEIGKRALNSDKPSQKLFGALLAKALQFPDQNYVYLVDGKPVITFWGFVSLDKKFRQDAFDCLTPDEVDPPLALSRLAPVTAPAASRPAAAVEPQLSAAPAIVPVPEQTSEKREVPTQPVGDAAPPAAPVKSPAAAWLRYGWLVPAAVLMFTAGVQLKGCGENDAATAPPSQSVQPTASVPVTPVISLAEIKLPLAAATVAPPSQPVRVAEPAPAPVATAEVRPAQKDDLVMPQDSIKNGSVKFLNGSWRVKVQMKVPLTGTPPMLRYQLQNGKGSARMTQGDGVSCRVEVFAGLMKSGNLVINSRNKARCSDGSRYQMPELVCKQDAIGAAECSGRYNDDTVLPMTMKRENK